MFKALELEAYDIPVGGSNRLGTWGYIQKWEEWQLSGVLDQTKNIFVPVGSGGTAAGIIIGNYLTGSRHKIYLLQVADTIESLTEDIKSIIGQFTISGKPISIEEAMKKVTMFEAVGLGYAHRYVYHYLPVITILAPMRNCSSSGKLESRPDFFLIVSILAKLYENPLKLSDRNL